MADLESPTSDKHEDETAFKTFAREKEDIVRGFLKEKEIIKQIHEEQLEHLQLKFENEKEGMQNSFEREKSNLLAEFQNKLVERDKNIEIEKMKLQEQDKNEVQTLIQQVENRLMEENRNLQKEFENYITEKSLQIQLLSSELECYRLNGRKADFENNYQDRDLQHQMRETTILKHEHDKEIDKLKKEFSYQKLEAERGFEREKAALFKNMVLEKQDLVKKFESEKAKIIEEYENELQFKTTAIENILIKKSEIESMQKEERFMREMKQYKTKTESEMEVKLKDQHELIKHLQKENNDLLNSLQAERFSLGRVYNREIALLTNTDAVSKEDIEVALIDEVAKLKQQQEETLRQVDKKWQQKIEDMKKSQEPLRVLQTRHEQEKEELLQNFRREKEQLEERLRNEQFNLLRSLTFEKHDIEKQCQELIKTKEEEFREKENKLCESYEKKIKEFREEKQNLIQDLQEEKDRFVEVSQQIDQLKALNPKLEETLLSSKQSSDTAMKKPKGVTKEMGKDEMKIQEALNSFNLEEELVYDICNKLGNVCASIRVEEQKKAEQCLKDNEVILDNKYRNEVATLLRKYDLEKEQLTNKVAEQNQNATENRTLDENIRNLRVLINERDTENKILRDKCSQERREIVQEIEKLKDRLHSSLAQDQQAKLQNEVLPENERNVLQNAINVHMKELDNLREQFDDFKDTVEGMGDGSIVENFMEQLKALDHLTDLEDSLAGRPSTKENQAKLNEELQTIKRNIALSYNIDKLELDKNHREHERQYQHELLLARSSKLQLTLDTLKLVHEKLGTEPEESEASKQWLKSQVGDELMQEQEESVRHDMSPTEPKVTGEGDSHYIGASKDLMRHLRKEKEELMRALDEMSKEFKHQKEDMLQRIHTQHKEYVMSPEAEIIETLLRQKSSLEEALNLERFYLSRIYYLEMNEELQDLLTTEKDKMRKQSDKQRLEIVLNYSKEIAELHKILSEKDDRELELMEERNETARKVFLLEDVRSSGTEDITSELQKDKERLEVAIQMQREIAQLQQMRQQEHQHATEILADAVEVIKELASDNTRISALNESSSLTSGVPTPISVEISGRVTPVYESSRSPLPVFSLSEGEIKSKEDLKRALQSLVRTSFPKQTNNDYESDTKSGATSDIESDFESESQNRSGEDEEEPEQGVDSGAESNDGEKVTISRKQLNLALTLERFNLSRVYNSEYKDSLKKALAKLSKVRELSNKKSQDTENILLDGMRDIVERAKFESNNNYQLKENKQTQTLEGDKNDADSAGTSLDDELSENRKEVTKEKEQKGTRDTENVWVGDKCNDIQHQLEQQQRQQIDEGQAKQPTAVEKEQEKESKPVVSNQEHKGSYNKETKKIEHEEDVDKDKDNQEAKQQNEIDKFVREKERADKTAPAEVTNQLQESSRAREHDSVPTNRIQDHEGGDIARDRQRGNEKKHYDNKEEAKGAPISTDNSLGRQAEESEINKTETHSQKSPKDRSVVEEQPQVSREKDLKPGRKTSTISEDRELEEGQKYDEKQFPIKTDSSVNKADDKTPTREHLEGAIVNVSTKKDEALDKEKDVSKGEAKTSMDEADKMAQDQQKQTSNKELKEHKNQKSLDTPKDDSQRSSTEMPENAQGPNKTLAEDKPQTAKAKENLQNEGEKETPEKSKVGDERQCAEKQLPDKADSSLNNIDAETATKERLGDDAVSASTEEDKTLDEEKGLSKGETKNVIDEADNIHEEQEKRSKELEEYTEQKKLDNSKSHSSVDLEDKNVAEMFLEDEKENEESFEKLKNSNKELNLSFNILRNLVGNNFVKEIPQLQKTRSKERKDAKPDKIALEKDEFAKLQQEKRDLSEEMDKIDKSLAKLRGLTDDKIAEKDEEINKKELDTLKSLETLENLEKKLEDKEAMDYLIREKRELTRQLNDTSEQIRAQKDRLKKGGKLEDGSIAALMCEENDLKDKFHENITSLKQLKRELQGLSVERENGICKLEERANELSAQLRVLNKVQRESTNFEDNQKRSSGVRSSEITLLPQSVAPIVKQKFTAEEKAVEAENKVQKTKKDIERYKRMIENQDKKMLPLAKKIHRLEDALERQSIGKMVKDGQIEETVSKTTQAGKKEENGSSSAASFYDDKVNECDTLDFQEFCRLKLNQELAGKENDLQELQRKIDLLSKDIATFLSKEVVWDFESTKSALDIKQVLQKDIENVKSKISEEKNRMENDGNENLRSLANLIREKSTVENEMEGFEKQIEDLKETRNNIYDSEELDLRTATPEVKLTVDLLKRKDEMEQAIQEIENEIFEEQDNFLDALKYRNKENIPPSTSINRLISGKKKSESDLAIIGNELAALLENGGLEEHFQEVKNKRIIKKMLEHEVETVKKKLKNEPMRSAGALANLVQEKAKVEEELKFVNRMLKESKLLFDNEIQANKEFVSCLPDNVVEAFELEIVLLEETESDKMKEKRKELEDLRAEMDSVCSELNNIEKNMKDKGMELEEKLKDGREFSGEENVLGELIDSKKGKDKLKLATGERISSCRDNRKALQQHAVGGTSKAKETVSKETDETSEEPAEMSQLRSKLKDSIEKIAFIDRNIHERLELIENSCGSDNDSTKMLETLSLLINEQSEFEKALRCLNEIIDCLNKKDKLQQQLQNIRQSQHQGKRKNNLPLNELEELLQKSAEHENRKNQLKTKLADEINKLQKINKEKEVLHKHIKEVDNKLSVVHDVIEEISADLEKNEEHLNTKDENEEKTLARIDNLNKEQKLLQSQIHELSKRVRKEEDTNEIQLTEEVVNLRELLKEKENLKTYLREIESKLEELKPNTTAKTSQEEEEFNREGKRNELTKHKRELVSTLQELKDQRKQLQMVADSEELEEAIAELTEDRQGLEQKDEELTKLLFGTSDFEEKPVEEETTTPTPNELRYYNKVLEQLRNENGTLIDLLKVKDTVKEASAKQRELAEETVRRLKLRTGENLFNFVTSENLKKQLVSNQLPQEVTDSLKDEMTVLDVLKEQTNDIEELRQLSEKLDGEINTLRGTFGEDMVDELLIPSLCDDPMMRNEFITEVEKERKTISDILEEQREMLETVKSKLGSNLFDSMIKAQSETKAKNVIAKFDTEVEQVVQEETDEITEAKEIIKPTSEEVKFAHKLKTPQYTAFEENTLEEVLSFYEKELESLKVKLGKGLFNSLLEMDKESEVVSQRKDNKNSDAQETRTQDNAVTEVKDKAANSLEFTKETGFEPSLEEVNDEENMETSKEKESYTSLISAQRYPKRLSMKYDTDGFPASSLKPLLAFDRTLEDVLTAYERELATLREENEIFRGQLGCGLADSLLDIGLSKRARGVEMRRDQRVEKPEEPNEEPKLESKLEETSEDVLKSISEDDKPQIEGRNNRDLSETPEGGICLDTENEKRAVSPTSLDHTQSEKSEEHFKPQMKALIIMERDSVILEELLKDYEQELERTRSRTSDRNKELTGDTEVEYEAKLKTYEDEKRKLQDMLHNLREKIGPNLVQSMEMNDNKEDRRELKEMEDEEKKFSFEIIRKMAEEQKTLEDIVLDYKANIETLQTEVGKLDEISKLESKINELKTESKEHQNKLQILTGKLGDHLTSDILNVDNEKASKRLDESQPSIMTKMAKDNMTLGEAILDYEEELDKCHKEIEDCRESLNKIEEKIGKGLCETLLRHGTEKKEPNATIHLTLQAVEIMNEENKPLSTVIAEYEAQLAKLKSENECLRKITEGDEEMKSISEIVLDVENRLTETKEKQKMAELKFEDLRKKLGCSLADEMQDTAKRSIASLQALDLMTREQIPLSDVIKKYEIDLQTLHEKNEDLKTSKSWKEKQIDSADGTATLEKSMTENECRYTDEKYGEELTKIKEELNNLKEKVGQDLVKEMDKLDADKNKTFCLRAVEYMSQEAKPLSEVIKVYENKLDKFENYECRTTNPKQDENVRTSDEADGQKAIGEEIENETTTDLRHYDGEQRQQLNTTKEGIDQENENLNKLINRLGEDLAQRIITLEENKTISGSFKALDIMNEENKTLSDVIDEYEDEIVTLRRENKNMQRLTSGKDDKETIGIIVTEYENKLSTTSKDNAELEKELKQLRKIVGQDLVKSVINPEEKKLELRALEVLRKNEKTIAAVLEDYEEDLDRLKRENKILNRISTEDVMEESSVSDIDSGDKNNSMQFSNRENELERELNSLRENIGVDFATEITKFDAGKKDYPIKALHFMLNEKKPLSQILIEYETKLETLQKENNSASRRVGVDDDKQAILAEYEEKLRHAQNKLEKSENELKRLSARMGKNTTSTKDAQSSSRGGKRFPEEDNQTRNEDKSLQAVLARTQEAILPAAVEEVTMIDKQQQTDGWDNKNNLTDKSGSGTNEEHLQNLKESRDCIQHKLTVLEKRMGGNLAKAIIDMETTKQKQSETTTLGKKTFTCSILDKMAAESKTLTEVLEEQESELTSLSTKNQILQNITDKDKNNRSVLEALSNYEDEIKNEKQKKRDLQHKLDVLSAMLGSKLSEDLLHLGEEDDKSPQTKYSTSAAKSVAEEKKSLAEILKEYEDDLRKLNDENNKLKKASVSGKQDSFLVSDYEDKLQEKEEEKEAIKKELDELSLKVGKELCQDLTDKSKGDQGKGGLIVLQIMDQQGIPLAKVISDYEDNIRKLETNLAKLGEWVGHDLKEKILEFDKSQPKNVEHRFSQVLATVMYGEDKTLAEIVAGYEAELIQLRRENNKFKANERDVELLTSKLGHDFANEILRSQHENSEDKSDTNLKLKALDKMGKEQQTIAEILESYEDEIEKGKEEKAQLTLLADHLNILTNKAGKNLTNDLLRSGAGRDLEDAPSVNALLTLQREGNTLEEIIQEYENKIQSLEGDDVEHKSDNTIKDFETRINELETELDEERTNRKALEKDVQDLLQDIVSLKMKQADEDTDHEDDKRSLKEKLKEDYELKKQNKYLQDELQQEKQKSKALGESKVELSNELESTIAENDGIVEAKERRIKEDENKLAKQEHEISVLKTKNDDLEREAENVNKQLKEKIDELNEIKKANLMRENDKELQTTTEIENLKKDKEKTKRSLDEQKYANQELKNKVDGLQEEVDKLNKLNAQTESEIAKEKGLADEKYLYEKQKNESLKTQLDENEEMLAETIKRYQSKVFDLEQQKEKVENQLNQEIEILAHKLELERTTAERQKKDFDEALNREREHVKQDLELEFLREKERMKNDFDFTLGEHKVSEEKLRNTIDESEDSHKEEKKEMTAVFMEEKNRLQDAFNKDLKAKDEEHRRTLEQIKLDMERNFAREKHELVDAFEKEKEDIQSSARKTIVEEVSAKKCEIEADFQAMLSQVAKDHENDIEAVENDLKASAEKFKEEKENIVSKMQDEKEELINTHEKEKKLLENTIQNLLKEIVKLKHQRKELRHIHRKEKAEIEEICEQEKAEMKINFDRCKTDLVEKLQEDFSLSVPNEISKREALIENLRDELNAVETRNKNLELQLTKTDNQRGPQNEIASLELAQKNDNRGLRERIEQEYEKKLEKEKNKFEETMQGLRREVNTLQEKRKLIQDRVYNQDHSNNEQKVIEKSIANYKKEILTKLEEEMLQKMAREKRPLEESIAELQKENEELKQQKWELKSQFRRERLNIEEEFEKEKENIESRFVKEKEDLKSKYESRVQKEQMKRTMVEKVHRATSPADSLDSSRNEEAMRALQWEKLDLQDDNEHLKSEIKRLTMKLESIETNFQDVMASEKAKVQRMKQIQEKIPKRVTFSDEVKNQPRESYLSPSTSNNEQKLLQAVREKDAIIRQLQDAKRLYENVFGELCEEAGLFELDQDVFS